ncbi:MAG: glycosyltransferase family 4 protein [Bacteroidales bacterium]|nr:glycosyltransferase family 4 protein [Bacteroidales bacterium]
MRVLMFGWEFPPHITGGLGTACFGITKGLSKHGTEVIFVVPKAYGDEDQQVVKLRNASDIAFDLTDEEFKEYWNHIKYMEVGSNIIPYVSPEVFSKTIEENIKTGVEFTSNVFSRRYEFSGKYSANLMEEVARYALIASALALKENFDVIHAHDWLTYPAGIAAKNSSGKKLVVHMHATEFDRTGGNVNQQVYDIERLGMETADAVITVSNFTRNIVIEKYGINPSKVITVHNAVDQTTPNFAGGYTKNYDEKLVTFLGRITMQKGPEYFIEAAYKVLQKTRNVRFAMAGSGDMLIRMIKRVAQLHIADKFHFTGFLGEEDVQRIFSLSDVFVMPSVSEPFGIVPLEAMRSNVPVIISKQSGVSEVLKHALKVDFWDIDAIADSIYGLCRYDGLSKMFIKYGKQEVENLKWEDSALKINEVYQRLLNS